jgi:hypothetical protein
MIDRSSKKFPFMQLRPEDLDLPYYERSWAVRWDEFSLGQWGSYADALHEMKQGLDQS